MPSEKVRGLHIPLTETPAPVHKPIRKEWTVKAPTSES